MTASLGGERDHGFGGDNQNGRLAAVVFARGLIQPRLGAREALQEQTERLLEHIKTRIPAAEKDK